MIFRVHLHRHAFEHGRQLISLLLLTGLRLRRASPSPSWICHCPEQLLHHLLCLLHLLVVRHVLLLIVLVVLHLVDLLCKVLEHAHKLLLELLHFFFVHLRIC